MLTYLTKKTLEMLVTFIGITIISFAIIHFAPGKPTDVLTDLNPKITPEARAKLERYYGLDKPVTTQYILWIKRVVMLDFGESFSSDHRAVWTKIKERLPITLYINIASLLIILAIAIPIGISSAVARHSLYDKITTVGCLWGLLCRGFGWHSCL